jgi:hypothetical protein
MIINNQIRLSGGVKLLIVLITFCISLYFVYTGNWYQGLLVLNISLHYRDFIEYFTDFSDEIIYPEHALKSQEKGRNLEKFTGDDESLLGPANIELSNTYNQLYNQLYGNNTDNTLQYSSFYDNNVNINKIKNNNYNENVVAENFYQQLYDKHEKNITQNSKPFRHENFINYKFGEVDPNTMTDFGSFSKLKFQKDQKIMRRAEQPYANDDIKLMNHIDLNHNIPWWQLSTEINGGFA